MSDLNEKLAQEAAELINGGEWRDGKWYSEGQRDAWRRALKPAADRILELEEQAHYANGVADLAMKHRDYAEQRIEKLEAALRAIANDEIVGYAIPGYAREALEKKDDRTYFMVCNALESLK
jgi:hypothetical protein